MTEWASTWGMVTNAERCSVNAGSPDGWLGEEM